MKNLILLLFVFSALSASAQKKVNISFKSPYQGSFLLQLEQSGKQLIVESKVPGEPDERVRTELRAAMQSPDAEARVFSLLNSIPQRSDKVKVDGRTNAEFQNQFSSLFQLQAASAATTGEMVEIQVQDGKQTKNFSFAIAELPSSVKELISSAAAAFPERSAVYKQLSQLPAHLSSAY